MKSLILSGTKSNNLTHEDRIEWIETCLYLIAATALLNVVMYMINMTFNLVDTEVMFEFTVVMTLCFVAIIPFVTPKGRNKS